MNQKSEQLVAEELWEANESLLLAGIRNHELADQLQQQLSFIQTVTDSLDEGVCALDRDGRITFSNASATKLIETPPSGLNGHEFHRLVHSDCETTCPLHSTLHAKTRFNSGEDCFEYSNGEACPVSYSVTLILVDGEMVGRVVAFRDITERKCLEQAQRKVLVQERAARTDAEAAVQLRTEILGTVTHDLRNPLTVIMGYAQRLLSNAVSRETVDNGVVVRGLEGIEAAAVKMSTILSELMDVAMLDAGKSLDLQRCDVDLAGIFSETVAHQQSLTSHHLELELPEEPLIGCWDPMRLERVLFNLLSNSIKYSPEDSCITLRLRQVTADGEWVVGEIQDRGVGIPKEDLPQVFTRFYRATNAAGSPAGVGLGLAGSKEIIEKHGGTISLDSTLGVGTTVTFWLPV